MDTTKVIQMLIKIADQQQQMIKKLALETSAQPSEVEASLKKANLWELSPQISPLLNQAGVPDTASVAISIIADKGPTIKYNAVLDPPNANVANKLSGLINKHYSVPMSQALKADKLNIEFPVTLNWLKF